MYNIGKTVQLRLTTNSFLVQMLSVHAICISRGHKLDKAMSVVFGCQIYLINWTKQCQIYLDVRCIY